MQNIIDNYEALLSLGEWCLDEYNFTETKARVQGVASQMGKFEFFFGLTLGTSLMRHADTLSSALQSKDLTASEGQRHAAMTVKLSKRCERMKDSRRSGNGLRRQLVKKMLHQQLFLGREVSREE